MSLKEQLNLLDVSLRFGIHVPSKSKMEATFRYIDKLIDSSPIVSAVPDNLVAEAVEALIAGQASTLSQRNLRLFCVAGLASLKNVSSPLDCVTRLLDEVSTRARVTLYRALLTGYLQIADLEFMWVSKIKAFLASHVDDFPPKWRERCQQYGLLDDQPCHKLAQAFRDPKAEFDHLLRHAGLVGSLRTSGIGKCLLNALCADLGRSKWLCEANADTELTRFLELIYPNEGPMYPGTTSQVSIVTALLGPCRDQEVAPEIERRIERFLLAAYSDPRVNPGKWGAVPPELVDVLTRWLTKQAMSLLIEVLNKTADDHHWESRHDFWGFYLDNDYVEEAWVVFGPDPYRHALDLVRSTQNFSAGTFARIEKGGGQIQQNHSVLLMRIDSVIIAEWTHNGRVRLWDRQATERPPFYRSGYRANVLRGSGARQGPQAEYTHDAHGHWKEKVARFIWERTGIQYEQLQKQRAQSHPVRRQAEHSRRQSNTAQRARSQAPREASHPQTYGGVPASGTCKGCDKTKPASEFYLSRRRPGELTVFCKQCAAENPLMGSKNN